MEKSRYSDNQILKILKQAEAGTPIPELCREHGMSSATFYKWRAKYGGMDESREITIRLACTIFAISEICYRYQPKLSAENTKIADILIQLTHNTTKAHRRTGLWTD